MDIDGEPVDRSTESSQPLITPVTSRYQQPHLISKAIPLVETPPEDFYDTIETLETNKQEPEDAERSISIVGNSRKADFSSRESSPQIQVHDEDDKDSWSYQRRSYPHRLQRTLELQDWQPQVHKRWHHIKREAPKSQQCPKVKRNHKNKVHTQPSGVAS